MNKALLHQQVIAQLTANLRNAQQAALTAYETATHEENIAENKYDTLGLEASYLAAGQARRVEEIRQTLAMWEQLRLRPYDAQQGIQLSALVWLCDAQGAETCVFIGPDGAGLKLNLGAQQIQVISPRAPLGQRLIGSRAGDEIELRLGSTATTFEILRVL
ncbi:MAG: GreA/GreB family elongation factor [Pseudomonas sp.]|uniref:GreA/GreB family elongation factor n=1 Tax=Pseudomonas sp. TaxID=306 RepID=UPI003981B1D4